MRGTLTDTKHRPAWIIAVSRFAVVPLGKHGVLERSSSSEHAFGSGAPFSLGVEEELFLVAPASGASLDAADQALGRLGELRGTGEAEPRGTVEAELHACQVELITEPCRSTAEAIAALARLRRAVLATGFGLLGSGTHPLRPEGAGRITDKVRYQLIHERLGDAVATPVGGLHVHVGMPDPDTAIRAFNGLRRHLPLLQAMAANSPFRHGRDSGLESARELSMRGWPRSGTPRAMLDLEDFHDAERRLAAAADVPDYTWFWWNLRPHPRLGTVEVRALDAQTTLRDAAGLVALVHCLARHEAEAEAEPAPDPPPSDVIDEGNFQAARYGTRAWLPDAAGTRRPFAEVLAGAFALARRHADELDCSAELEQLHELVAIGGGAGRQRALCARGGIEAVPRALAALSGET